MMRCPRSVSALILLTLSAGPAHTAPDPLSGGKSLTKVVVESSTGDVKVLVRRTQHVRLDGSERDVRRAKGVLRIERMSQDVNLVVPPHVELDLRNLSGSVTVIGAVRLAKIRVLSGQVTVTGEVGALSVKTGSGDQRLRCKLTDSSRVQAETASGDLNITIDGDTPFRLDAKTMQGELRGSELGAPTAKAVVELHAATGDIRVKRAL